MHLLIRSGKNLKARTVRDDFTPAVKHLLAERVGYRCSNPDCRQLTSGPQEDPSGSINVGVAAHVSAASPGGPRYDPSLVPAERRSPQNGLWLCQTCGKLIDSDNVRYDAPRLREWKNRAEELALEELEGRAVAAPKISAEYLRVRGDRLLDDAISAAPLEPNADFAYMHLVSQPGMDADEFLEVIDKTSTVQSAISEAITFASSSEIFSHQFSPGFSQGAKRPTSDGGWLIYMNDQPAHDSPRKPYYTLDLDVKLDGRVHLFCGRAAERREVLFLFDVGVAETALRFIAFVGKLYQYAGYSGPCSLGIAVTGVQGAVSRLAHERLYLASVPFDKPTYRRAIHEQALRLLTDPRAVARRLLAHLFHATTGGQLDPFATNPNLG